MPAIRFIHAADLHLGRPFSGLTRSDETLGRLFQQAGYKAWDRIVRTALDKKVDFVTLGGDVFDRTSPTIRARVALKNGIDRLNRAGIPVFLALGNHDPLNEFPDALRSLPGLHVFGPEPEGKDLHCPEWNKTVRIYGVSFDRPAVQENLVRGFRRERGVGIAIGLVHANVAGVPGHDSYAPCSTEDLMAARMDVWCMGHVHLGRVLTRDPLILYAGTSQGAHVNEGGQRGCYMVTVDGPGDASAEFIPVAPVNWAQVGVDITGLSTEEDILEAIEQACDMLCPADDSLEAVVARIRLNGRSAVHFRGSYQRTGEFGEVLSERLALLRVPVFPESILDMTRSELDLDSVIQQGGFLADLLELSRRASEEPDVAAELVDSIAESVPKTTYGDLKAEIQSLREPVILEAFLQEAGELVAELFVEPSGS